MFLFLFWWWGNWSEVMWLDGWQNWGQGLGLAGSRTHACFTTLLSRCRQDWGPSTATPCLEAGCWGGPQKLGTVGLTAVFADPHWHPSSHVSVQTGRVCVHQKGTLRNLPSFPIVALERKTQKLSIELWDRGRGRAVRQVTGSLCPPTLGNLKSLGILRWLQSR